MIHGEVVPVMSLRIPSRRWVQLGAALLATSAAAAWLWRASSSDPMAAFRTFPHAYISEAAAGYDETAVVVERGTVEGPPAVRTADGATAWPAYWDPSGRIVPPLGGRPYLIPLIPEGDGVRTPAIKPLGRSLRSDEILNLVRYLTPEGVERMAAFRKETSP
jgi:hypothetical protein